MAETRVGIIGVGGFGLFCLKNYQLIPDVRITWVADINADLLAKVSREFAIPHTTLDWRELVASPEVDIVYIATPPSLHAEQATAAATACKHVLCEKPMALSMEDANAIMAAAEEQQVRVGINFVMRYSRLYEMLDTVVKEGLFGRPQRFLFENNAKDLPASHWFWDPKLSGGIPVEHVVHFFDIFGQIYGPGQLLWAGRTCRPTGAEDKWLAVLQYGNRMFGTYYNGFDKPGNIESTWSVVELARGRIRLDGWIPETLTLDGDATREELERLTAIFPDLQKEELDGGSMPVLADGTETVVAYRVKAQVAAGEKLAVYGAAVRDVMVDFIAWTKDPQHQPRVTGEDGRRALQMALDVTAMARSVDC